MLYSKQQRDLSYPRATCARCGLEFPKRKDYARFCSDKCRVAYAQGDRAITIINQNLATVADDAQMAGVSRSTIRRWAKAGKLRVKAHAGRVFVYRADVETVKG